MNLSDILPPQIIRQLCKKGCGRLIREPLEVSILFTDIVGFTNLASSVTTEVLMDTLNKLFSGFDGFVARHGVFKVETIGENCDRNPRGPVSVTKLPLLPPE